MTFSKSMKIGMPNYSNMDISFGMTVESVEGEEIDKKVAAQKIRLAAAKAAKAGKEPPTQSPAIAKEAVTAVSTVSKEPIKSVANEAVSTVTAAPREQQPNVANEAISIVAKLPEPVQEGSSVTNKGVAENVGDRTLDTNLFAKVEGLLTIQNNILNSILAVNNQQLTVAKTSKPNNVIVNQGGSGNGKTGFDLGGDYSTSQVDARESFRVSPYNFNTPMSLL